MSLAAEGVRLWDEQRRFLPSSPQGVLDRFSQIQPKLIFSVEAVVYNGKEHGHLDKLQQVVEGARPSRRGRRGGAQGKRGEPGPPRESRRPLEAAHCKNNRAAPSLGCVTLCENQYGQLSISCPVTVSLSPSGLSDLKKVVVIPYITSRDKIDISKIPNR